METKQLYPLADGKVPQPHPTTGELGVSYAGRWVKVIRVEGEFFTELSLDHAVAEQTAKFTGWDWNEDDTSASANAHPWPTAPVDPDTRTYETMVSATRNESGRLLSNDRPLKLKPDDEASLRAEIAAALAREQAQDGN